MDNKCSVNFKRVITEDWKATFQLVPPNMHRRNLAERSIHMFKMHFLAILAGIDSSFQRYLCYTLLPHTELALNIFRWSMLNPLMSAWEYFNGAFGFSAAPMGPIGCHVTIHNNPSKQKSCNHWGHDGFYVGPALERYRCFKVVDSTTNSTSISDTVDFIHS